MRRLIALLCLATVIGCTDGITDPTTSSISGAYDLVTVNGAPLPATLPFGTDHIVLLSYRLVVFANSTFTLVGQAKYTTPYGVTAVDHKIDGGSYVLKGSKLALAFNSPDATGTGEIGGNVITITVAGDQYVYAK